MNMPEYNFNVKLSIEMHKSAYSRKVDFVGSEVVKPKLFLDGIL